MRWFCLLFSLLFYAPTLFADPVLEAVENFVRQELRDQPGRVSVTAGPLDSRLRLPACTSYQAYLPNPSTRLVGNASVGLRCLSPSRWSIFVPVKIAIETRYLAAATPLAAGQIVQAGDLAVLSGQLGNLPTSVLTDPAQAIGKTLKISLAAGQPLRSDVLTSPLLIQTGQTVLLVFRGAGFTATNEGRALNRAAEGQMVQVRTLSGTVVSGIAQANGTILVSPSP
ncbi:MAG: flagellar basal body P-ring formation protein FlgA [Zoogloeaceae bacterium]|jgi:flagella basal body P-ring formation protein FlgA|nr:flagellar basal body P-ring formation protein FlgA [Zoogloeaceae bacterium]